jgi:hypothetical protein
MKRNKNDFNEQGELKADPLVLYVQRYVESLRLKRTIYALLNRSSFLNRGVPAVMPQTMK